MLLTDPLHHLAMPNRFSSSVVFLNPFPVFYFYCCHFCLGSHYFSQDGNLLIRFSVSSPLKTVLWSENIFLNFGFGYTTSQFNNLQWTSIFKSPQNKIPTPYNNSRNNMAECIMHGQKSQIELSFENCVYHLLAM